MSYCNECEDHSACASGCIKGSAKYSNFSGLTGLEFSNELRRRIALVGMSSGRPAPWEVVMEAVIEVEKRIQNNSK